MTSDRDSYEIVRLILMLAHSRDLEVVADGSETTAQVSELKRLGFEMAQGYLYSPPVAPEAAFLACCCRATQAEWRNLPASQLTPPRNLEPRA
jgi:EAL domain-containing protein (putative c-di-GMP-specific phosphodiesterase class I)